MLKNRGMTSIAFSRRMRFMKYFTNNLEYASEADKMKAGYKARRKGRHKRISPDVNLSKQSNNWIESQNVSNITEIVVRENKQFVKVKSTDESTQTDNEESSQIAFQTDELKMKQNMQKQAADKKGGSQEKPPAPKSPSPSDEVTQMWNSMREKGEPKIIISIPKLSYTYYFNKEKFDMKILNEALAEVVRSAKCCGLLIDKNDKSNFKSILRDEIQIDGIHNQLYSVITGSELYKGSNSSMNDKEPESLVDDEFSFDTNSKLLALERYINKYERSKFSPDAVTESRLPVVLLVVGGALSALEHVARAVHHDISVVVVKGTGGSADFIDSCINGKFNLRRTLPLMFLQKFEKEHLDKIEVAVDLIRQREWMVSSCDLKSETVKALWDKLTDGIIRAWSFELEEKEDNHAGGPIFTEQGLSISKHAVKIDLLSKKQLFGGYELKPQKDLQNLQMTFTDAMVMNNIDIVLDILSKSDDFQLTEKQYSQLIRELIEVHDKPGEKNSFTWLKYIYPKTVETLDDKESVTVICENLLKGQYLSRCGTNIFCCRRRKDKDGKKSEKSKKCSDYILLIGILFNRMETFQVWKKCKVPLMTALVASVVLSSMAEKAGECFEEQLQKDFNSHSNVFKRRAVLLLEKLYECNQGMAKEALDYVCDVWNQHESPIHFSHQHNLEEFISHSSVQKEANKRMYGYNTEMSLRVDLPSNKKEQSTARTTKAHGTHNVIDLMKRHWQDNSMEKFICAPIVRLIIHVICFVIAIFIFSIFVTTGLKDKSVSFMELLVFVFICGELLEEFLGIVRSDEHSQFSLRRVILHLYDIWNVVDCLCIILYIVAFLLHLFALPGILVHIKRLYSVSLFLMFLRVLNFLLLFKKLGIIIIMVKEMLTDLLYYLVILFVLLLGGGVVYHANLYPNHDTLAFPNSIEFWRIWTVLRIPFWQVFGDPMLDTIEASDGGDCTNNETLWRNNPDVSRCPSYDWITPVIAALYMMLTNWLLLNIVIAMFSSRFDDIMENASLKWRYHRHSVVIDYEHRYPSPFNIPIRLFFSWIYNCNTKRKSCFCHCCIVNEKAKVKPVEMLKKQMDFAEQIIKEEENMDSKV